MEPGHWALGALLVVAIAIPIVGFYTMMRVMMRGFEKDEAINAATFLALRELRERFEHSRK